MGERGLEEGFGSGERRQKMNDNAVRASDPYSKKGRIGSEEKC